MKIKDVIIGVLASKSTLCILLLSWIGVIVFSNFMLPPSDDGRTYFEPAIAFLHNKVQWGVFMGDNFDPHFIGFPTFSFAQFVFLFFASLFKIPINIYTYKMFHMILIFALISLTVHLLYLYLYRLNNSDYIFKSNIFLVLLSITPFAQQCWQTRPEIFGNVLIVCSLIFYCYWELSNNNKNIFYYLGAVFLGLSAVVHPNFMIVAGILTIAIIAANFIRGNRLQSVLFGVVASIPLLLLMAWFLIYYPESIQEFRLQVIHHKGSIGGIKRLVAEALMLSGWQSTYIKLFYFIFWFPLLVIIVTVFALILKNIKSLLIRNTFNILLLPIFISIIILMIINRGDDSYFVIYSFFISLVFVLIMRLWKHSYIHLDSNKGISSVIALLCLISIIFMHTSVHSAKYFFSSEKYYYAPAVYKAVTDSLNPEDTLFITKKRQVPVFYDYVEAKYRGNTGINNIFIVFAQPALEYERNKLAMLLKSKVNSIKHDRTVWGVWKSRTNYDRENMKLILGNNYQPKDSNPLYLHFNIKEIIYEDKHHLFFRPEMIAFKEDIL
jgi:hypothetical protein